MKKEIKEENRFVEVITTVLENESENEGLESITAISQRMQGLTIRTYPAAQLSYSNLIEKGWAPQASLVNNSINLAITNTQRIDLALKVRSRDVISPMHCLNCMKILVQFNCHQGSFRAACICLLFLECPTLLFN